MVDLLVESSDRATRWRLPVALAVAAGCYLLLLLVGSRLLNDADTYWQIVLGDWIVAHTQVPHVDTFSATMAGTPWISSQWLAQVLFAQSYAIAGWAGVVVLTAAAIAIAQGLLTRFLLERLATTPALVLSVAGLVLASPHMLARAHALALPVMVAWIAGLMRALDERRAPPFLLLPLMTLWANLHGGFTFGIFFIAPVALGGAVDMRHAPNALRVTLRWAGFGLLAIAAACITPYGPESILVTGRILGLGQALALIGEWQPQDFSTFAGFELCLLLGIGFALYRGLTHAADPHSHAARPAAHGARARAQRRNARTSGAAGRRSAVGTADRPAREQAGRPPRHLLARIACACPGTRLGERRDGAILELPAQPADDTVTRGGGRQSLRQDAYLKQLQFRRLSDRLRAGAVH